MTDPAVGRYIQELLRAVAGRLAPAWPDPDAFIAPHVWRDGNYVGFHQGRVVVWRGYRLRVDAPDLPYSILYLDVVDNVLPASERRRLFGNPFAEAIDGLTRYVVMFTTGFPLTARASIQEYGFIPRELTRRLHACALFSVPTFLQQPLWEPVTLALRLLQCRHDLAPTP